YGAGPLPAEEAPCVPGEDPGCPDRPQQPEPSQPWNGPEHSARAEADAHAQAEHLERGRQARVDPLDGRLMTGQAPGSRPAPQGQVGDARQGQGMGDKQAGLVDLAPDPHRLADLGVDALVVGEIPAVMNLAG